MPLAAGKLIEANIHNVEPGGEEIGRIPRQGEAALYLIDGESASIAMIARSASTRSPNGARVIAVAGTTLGLGCPSGESPLTSAPEGARSHVKAASQVPSRRRQIVLRVRRNHLRSKRSRFITLLHTATKSFTNFDLASSLA